MLEDIITIALGLLLRSYCGIDRRKKTQAYNDKQKL